MHSAVSSSSSSFHAPARLGPSAINLLQTHYSSSFFFNPTPNRNPFSTANKPSLLSAQQPSRKLICTPPAGKHVREDYLVVVQRIHCLAYNKKCLLNFQKKLSAKEVQDLVKGERNVPLIIDFYATWCGPCILMAQELEMLAVEYENNVLIVKVDTDNEYEFACDMQVRGLPTVYFISPDPSKDAIRTEGLIPLQMMRDIIENEM